MNEYYDSRPPLSRRIRNLVVHSAKRLVQRMIYGGLACIGFITRQVVHPDLSQPIDNVLADAKRILVIRLDLIGDVVLTTPVVRALHKANPEARIDVFAMQVPAEVLQDDPDIRRVLTYNPNVWRRPQSLFKLRNYQEAYHTIKSLRDARYDLCISVCGDWASVFAFFAAPKRSVGYKDEAYPYFLTDPVAGKRYRERKHEVDYCMDLLKPLQIDASNGTAIPRLHVCQSAQEQASSLLQEMGIDASDRIIGVQVSSSNGVAKRWPLGYWAALGDKLIEELSVKVILIGAAADKPLINRVKDGMKCQVVDFSGLTTIPILAAVLSRCSVVVSGDSGPLHIAGAVGTPVVGLYGPTDPHISGPYGQNSIVLRQNIWCSPCYDASRTADCRFYNPICMKGITVRQVYDAVARQLESTNVLNAASSRKTAKEVN